MSDTWYWSTDAKTHADISEIWYSSRMFEMSTGKIAGQQNLFIKPIGLQRFFKVSTGQQYLFINPIGLQRFFKVSTGQQMLFVKPTGL